MPESFSADSSNKKSVATPRTPRTPANEAIAYFSSDDNTQDTVQIWELHLEDDGGPNNARSYIRLPPPTTPYILRISLSPGSVATRNGVLKSDFPIDGGAFERGSWKERKLPSDVNKPIKVDLPISAPGAFCYYIEYDEFYSSDASTSQSKRLSSRKGYFNVDPIITLPTRTSLFSQSVTSNPNAILSDHSHGQVDGTKTENIPLDAVAMLSIIAKWQGPVNQWDAHLEEASRRGYNFIHYTPLQSRGSSGSPYSIYDQMTIDNALLKDGRDSDNDGGVKQITEVLKLGKEKYGLGSLTDVVLNHTANNSPWLQEHPESGFSPANSPHLTPAWELDSAMIKLSGKLASLGLPTAVNSQSDLDRIASAIHSTVDDLQLWQFYVLNVDAEKEAVGSASLKAWDGENVSGKNDSELVEIIKKSVLKGYRSYAGRFATTSDPAVAAGFIKAARPDHDVAEAWGRMIDIINVDLYAEANDDAKAAKANIVDRLKYTRLDAHGPRLGEISESSPLIEAYFTIVPQKNKNSKFSAQELALANNGWIWAADPLSNFAEYPGKSYIRREVIAWADCVKLRYGKSPEDNPWLWEHITSYCELLAELFDGFRLDNCHSTPLPVGVHMIDAARAVNPNLYVMAELFTGSQEMDLKFVSQIGINSLVREAYNGSSPKELSGLIYEFGVTKAIGSISTSCLSSKEDFVSPIGKGAVRTATVTPLSGSKPHAFFYDVTHDNETPLDKRTAEDALATGALMTFTAAAIGSTKGFDDLYPKLLNLVTDKRLYEVSSKAKENGIGKVKRVLNSLHRELATGGFVEGHVHQENDYIVMHRVHPSTHKGYLLVAHTAFNKGVTGRGDIAPFKLSHQDVRYICGASIQTHFDQYKESDQTFKSIPSELSEVEECIIRKGKDDHGPYSEIIVPNHFEPGSVMLFETEMTADIGADIDETIVKGSTEAFADLNRVELNIVLYRADGEEKDATGGDGVYDLPGVGPLAYCGLEGWMYHLRHVIENNDLGHPLCTHLRQGTWAMDYIIDRLEKQTETFPGLAKPAKWLKERFDTIRHVVAPFLRPKYFSMVILEAYKAARLSVIEQCSDFIASGTAFTHDLALCAIQMYGQVKSASIDPSKPVPSLAAGLPHFAAGWARCWGRDVFISLRGLFLTTGDFPAARDHILAFGSTLKHGLIPNLLDSCRNPRYNCRDGPWFFCQNIQDYTKMCPGGEAILKDVVKRRFPADDSWVAWDDQRAYAYSSTVAELVQEILQRHAEGIEFREYNAGPNLDMDMTDEGYNQKIWVDWKTGIIFGGNRYNCGTWQDKMGSSDKAGNKGLPATPRDGAPIEITGLLKSTLTWVDGLVKKGLFPFKGVDATIDGKKTSITYKAWADLLQDNFERCYWVPENASEDGSFDVNPKMVNRRGIYKDVYGTPKDREWADYQFRSNFPIAMVNAPELFTPEKAMVALRLADKHLKGPLGMRTLDHADSAYRGDYNNSDDSTDQAVAKGWNYHQGPQWLWPSGDFAMAWLHFDQIAGDGKKDRKYTLHHISEWLLNHRKYISTDKWRGLPELQNDGGAYCHDSCETQAWSSSKMLDTLHMIYSQEQE